MQRRVTPEEMVLLQNALRRGRKNAMSRTELAVSLGWSDRKMRMVIESARKEGVLIANEQDGNGYFFPETKAELEAQYRQNQNRAMSILVQQKHIRRALKEVEA